MQHASLRTKACFKIEKTMVTTSTAQEIFAMLYLQLLAWSVTKRSGFRATLLRMHASLRTKAEAELQGRRIQKACYNMDDDIDGAVVFLESRHFHGATDAKIRIDEAGKRRISRDEFPTTDRKQQPKDESRVLPGG
eukprot:TRINITY_DN78719_c0_g1_i1.p2 TRINITY_DN78719_c0_g1~~TRINITY_DN78719_c0_g1_i1.p2  ORF type:complete len:136 (+),score=26.43 TRINITY_DN78719_c0_g1_i1:175-582(+)